MSAGPWIGLPGDAADVYIWGSYLAGVLLVVIEISVLAVRQRSILDHLGWKSPKGPADAASPAHSREDGGDPRDGGD